MASEDKENIFVFIEPVNHGYKVVLAAKQLGYKLVVLHKMDLFAPTPYQDAVNAFDIDIRVDSWLDSDELNAHVDKLMEEYTIVGTYAGAELTLPFNAEVRERAGLPATSREVIEFCLDKYKTRDRVAQEKLTNLQYLSKKEVEALTDWPFTRPMFFKPCYGGGSAKVFKCRSYEDLQAAIDSWNDKSDIHVAFLRDYLEYRDEYLLEEAAEGELLSAESLVIEGEVHVLGLTSRTVLGRDNTVEMGATFPYVHPHMDKIVDKVRKIHKAVNFTHGPTHTEIMVSDDGEVELVELNLRFAGADVLEICCRAYDFDFATALVQMGTSLTPDLPTESAERFSTLQYVLPPTELVQFDTIEFSDDSDFTRPMKPLKSKLKSTSQQIDHIGCFIMSGDNYDTLMDRALKERSGIRVNGNPLADDENNVVIQR